MTKIMPNSARADKILWNDSRPKCRRTMAGEVPPDGRKVSPLDVFVRQRSFNIHVQHVIDLVVVVVADDNVKEKQVSTLFFPSGCSAAGVPLSHILIINFLLILGRFLLPSGKSQAHRHRRQRAPTQTHPKLGELCSVTSRLGKILKLLQFKPPTLRLKSSNVRSKKGCRAGATSTDGSTT